MTTPRTHALRYRIWAYCSPREWNVTIEEIANALDESRHRINGTLREAGWNSRVRTKTHDDSGGFVARYHFHGTGAAGHRLAADIVAGRIGNGESV